MTRICKPRLIFFDRCSLRDLQPQEALRMSGITQRELVPDFHRAHRTDGFFENRHARDQWIEWISEAAPCEIHPRTTQGIRSLHGESDVARQSVSREVQSKTPGSSAAEDQRAGRVFNGIGSERILDQIRNPIGVWVGK